MSSSSSSSCARCCGRRALCRHRHKQRHGLELPAAAAASSSSASVSVRVPENFVFNDGKPWRWAGGACGTGRQWTLPDSAGGDRRGSALQYAASCHQHCRWSVPTANLRPQDQESDHVAGKKGCGPSLGCGYLGQQLPSRPWLLSEKLHCLRLCKPVLDSNCSRSLC